VTAPTLRAVTTLTLRARRGDQFGEVVELPPLPQRAQRDVRIVLAAGARHVEAHAAMELAAWLCSGAARVVLEAADPTDALAELQAAIREVTAPLRPYRDAWGMTSEEVAAFARRHQRQAAAA